MPFFIPSLLLLSLIVQTSSSNSNLHKSVVGSITHVCLLHLLFLESREVMVEAPESRIVHFLVLHHISLSTGSSTAASPQEKEHPLYRSISKGNNDPSSLQQSTLSHLLSIWGGQQRQLHYSVNMDSFKRITDTPPSEHGS